MTIIVTSRLRLKPSAMDMDSIRTMVKWLNDPLVTRYSEQRHKIHSVETQLAYIKSFGPPNKFYEIRRANDLIGTLTAYIDEENSVADVGIMIGIEYWENGFGFEAWEAFCDHLFAHDIRKIEVGALDINKGMVRIFGKYGMFMEGERLAHFQVD